MTVEPKQLDVAVRAALGEIIAAAPQEVSDPFRARSASPPPRRPRRAPVVVGAGLLAAAAIAAIAIVNRDSGESDRAASVPGTTDATLLPGVAADQDVWPVQLATGLTPWYVIDNGVTEELTYLDGPAQGQLRCAEWFAGDGVVTCTALSGQGYVPSAIYTLDDDGRHYVEVSTLHAEVGLREYADAFAEAAGDDVLAIVVEDVMVGDWPGVLVAAPDGVHRVTVEPVPGTLVTVVTGSAYTRENALAIAADLRPVAAAGSPADLPLVLAESTQSDDGSRVIALGGVRDGELCLRSGARCVGLGDALILAQPTNEWVTGVVGLAAADVHAVSARWEDGEFGIRLYAPPVGLVRAFALAVPVDATLIAFDADRRPITDGAILTAPAPPLPATVPGAVGVDTTVVEPAPILPGTVAPTEGPQVFAGLAVGDDIVDLEISADRRDFCLMQRSTQTRGCDGLPSPVSPAFVYTAGWSDTEQIAYGLVDDGSTPWLETADGRVPIPVTAAIDGVRGFAVLHPFGEPGTIAVTDATGTTVFTYDIGE